MQKEKLLALQESVSTFFSLRLSLVEAVASRGNGRVDVVEFHENQELHPDLVDEFRIAFDLVDGHWD